MYSSKKTRSCQTSLMKPRKKLFWLSVLPVQILRTNLQFSDTYGIIQFAVTPNQQSKLFSVQDHENSNIGSLCLATKVLSASNDRDSHMQVSKVSRAINQQLNRHVFQLTCHTQTSSFIAAEFYCECENKTIVLSMLKDLDVHKKALVLAQTMLAAILYYKFYPKITLPTFPGYSYRSQTLAPYLT